MKGTIYKYPLRGQPKLHRYFISYVDRMGRYVEENFHTQKEAKVRIRVLLKSQRHLKEGAEIWTRERVLPEDRLF